VVALRRLNVREPEADDLSRPAAFVEPSVTPYPRWMSVTAIVAYCTVFWALILGVGAWALGLLS
jgi:hypothetical protein